ncbi:hypothetical protein VST7929_03173 [Vibrio stylophorae]|uniref:Uncharacterized protein n=1 Tax=Vibrio stylophorae TaxID=659351 RepID=A0ABN8DW42_9VIBR|nr:hypothetical protein [Vibrio stylophorae]CAH0535676.1 hypothetical protein VST7929_03173 [Vibrio stylophorae]
MHSFQFETKTLCAAALLFAGAVHAAPISESLRSELIAVEPSEIIRVQCAQSVLEIYPVGFEHINHVAILNQDHWIEEINQGSWFIDDVQCAAGDFALTLSHQQYGATAQSQMTLTVSKPDTAEATTKQSYQTKIVINPEDYFFGGSGE